MLRKSSRALTVSLVFGVLSGCGRQDRPSPASQQPTQAAKTVGSAETARPWRVVGTQGGATFVYVEPAKARDRQLAAQILRSILGNPDQIRGPVQVMFFDKESETPTAFPMTDSQMVHHVAHYKYNPNTSFEEFVWLRITDRKSSPPKVAQTKDRISPGYAEE